jgi:alpha-aminoadipate/glutamate carrier protein LysW
MAENIKKQIKCPECDNEFEYDVTGVEIGDIIECPICGANLEVMSVEPFEAESITTYK